LSEFAGPDHAAYRSCIVSTAEHYGPLEVALANGRRLLEKEPEAAVEQAREILARDEENRQALRLLARALRRLGRHAEGSDAELSAIKAASNEPALVGAAQAIQAGNLNQAEHLVRPYLNRFPDDPAGFRLLGEVAARVGRLAEAIKYLERAIELAPSYASAHLRLARVYHDCGDFREAADKLDQLLKIDPGERRADRFKATTLLMSGEYSEALQLYRSLVEKVPDAPSHWIGYGHVLNTVGRFEESVTAYRRCLSLRPAQGEAWWYLANLKTARFSPDDVAEMVATLDQPNLDRNERIQLHFALGKALEDGGEYSRSFEQYVAGNGMKVEDSDYDPRWARQIATEGEALFTADYFQRLTGGATSPDPIFIVGMPRAGSTLIEQILASHSSIEGTAELPYIPDMRKQLTVETGEAYRDYVPSLSSSKLTELGEHYLSSVGLNRKTGRPYFTDKLPNNWMSVGLILSILPNAKIIDARRHPMACGFSNFKQLYARGQEFSYSLDWMGRYYADYVRMMRHFDEILPGRIHRVIHEQLIETPEGEIRRLLDYVGVPFEEACLRFYETERPVRTPSAGQVRQPLNRKGMEQWLNFEPWLGELKEALGPVLTAYPNAPGRSELP
jgi:tetratricopeptide (TPR) repeat protein